MPAPEGKVHRERISTTMAIFMITAAIFLDLTQFLLDFIPVIGWIAGVGVTIFAYVFFWTWTSFLGISFSDSITKLLTVGRRKMLKVATMLIEYIPGLGGFVPGITIGIVATILFIWAEDLVYNSTHGRVDVEHLASSAEHHAKKHDTLRSGGRKIEFADMVASAQDNNLLPKVKAGADQWGISENGGFDLAGAADWKNKTTSGRAATVLQGIRRINDIRRNKKLATQKTEEERPGRQDMSPPASEEAGSWDDQLEKAA